MPLRKLQTEVHCKNLSCFPCFGRRNSQLSESIIVCKHKSLDPGKYAQVSIQLNLAWWNSRNKLFKFHMNPALSKTAENNTAYGSHWMSMLLLWIVLNKFHWIKEKKFFDLDFHNHSHIKDSWGWGTVTIHEPSNNSLSKVLKQR